MNNLLLLARLPVLEALVKLGAGVLIANGITLIMLFLVRFIVSDRAIFASAAQEKGRDPVRVIVDLSAGEIAGGRDPAVGASSGRKRSRYLPYRYDIGGVVTVGSQIMLPELEFFRAQWISDEDVDIAVRVGDVGRNRPRRRAAMTEYTDPTVIRYDEHLGRIGAKKSQEVVPALTRALGDPRPQAAQCMRTAQRRVLGDVAQAHPIPFSGAERAHQVRSAVADDEIDRAHAEPGQEPKVMADQGLIGDRQQRLRVLLPEGAHAPPATGSEDDTDVFVRQSFCCSIILDRTRRCYPNRSSRRT